jgi:hypothetical protein
MTMMMTLSGRRIAALLFFLLASFQVSWSFTNPQFILSSPGQLRRQALIPQEPPTTVLLFAEGDRNSNNNKAKGVYVRPSGAIERGSGFFVPGLEGPRVRLLFGGVLLLLTGLNHVLAMSNQGLSLEESVTIFYSLLVLFQAAIEFGKEELIVEGMSASASSKNSEASKNAPQQQALVQQWSQPLAEGVQSRVQWVAASYLSVTPATQLLLLKNDSILYRLGRGKDDVTTTTTNPKKGVASALDQLRQSKGGRIALPATHPAVVALGLTEARTVVLQRIADDACFVMVSDDQLLASFASSDLKWLGQLAAYVQLE